MSTFVLVVIVFSGMIILHELGHFLAAKFFKIPVEEFGVGIPPKVATLFRWGETEFTLNLLPIGGFVRPKGEDDPDVPDGLSAANPWKRLVVLLAGPVMNLLTAVIVFSIMVAQAGIPIRDQVLIAGVTEDSPASAAGFQADDLLVSVNGIAINDLDQARMLIRENVDTPVTFQVERASQNLTLVATPLSSRNPEQGAVGVLLSNPSRPASLGESLIGGVGMTGIQAAGILSMPILVMRGLVSSEESRLIGLKGIYDTFDAAIERDAETRAPAAPDTTLPTNYTIMLIGMLSVSLGVLNLLPIPALDGGRILFALPEILFNRRIPPRLALTVNGVAMMLLLLAMLFINVMDFVNPINIVLP